jgi:hypothetical protein
MKPLQATISISIVLLWLFVFRLTASPQSQPTFYKDVLPILQKILSELPQA